MKKYSVVDLVLTIIAAIAVAWIIASFVDVAIHNHSDYVYANWNLFSMLANKFIYGR